MFSVIQVSPSLAAVTAMASPSGDHPVPGPFRIATPSHLTSRILDNTGSPISSSLAPALLYGLCSTCAQSELQTQRSTGLHSSVLHCHPYLCLSLISYFPSLLEILSFSSSRFIPSHLPLLLVYALEAIFQVPFLLGLAASSLNKLRRKLPSPPAAAECFHYSPEF